MNESAHDLFEFIRSIKSPHMCSNSVFMANAVNKLTDEQNATIAIGKDAALLLVPDTENILRLYYYVRNDESFYEIKTLLPLSERKIVCDIIGKEPKAADTSRQLTDIGFVQYAKFQRMVCNRITADSALDFSDVEFARIEDAEEILEITHEEFDPLTAHIPSLIQLRERIRDNEILLVRSDGKIAGFTSFDSSNRRVALLDHVIVRKDYRGRGIGKRILNFKWSHDDHSSHYILWINELCSGPIRYHEKNGFSQDGMYNYILVWQY